MGEIAPLGYRFTTHPRGCCQQLRLKEDGVRGSKVMQSLSNVIMIDKSGLQENISNEGADIDCAGEARA
jgi:hypothetical protein